MTFISGLMGTDMSESFHPDLRWARLLPRAAVGPRSLRVVRAGAKLTGSRDVDVVDVDAARIAIVGESAGGGLGAALALLARDRGDIQPAVQVLSYPMLDDRTAAQTDEHPSRRRLWNATSNRFGWDAYLGPLAGGAVPGLAAPARAQELSGLAPAWIGVGTYDLFHDEDVTYADRLRDAGVSCDLVIIPGAYHGFDHFEARAAVSRDFLRSRLSALSGALGRPET